MTIHPPAADSLNPKPKNVITIETPHGKSVTGEILDKALGEHKPMWAFMAHWETGSGRINDIEGFSDACLKHGVMGIVDAASSLGVADFNIDDYPGVVAWASCPQKGMLSLPRRSASPIRRSKQCGSAGCIPMCTTRS